jgi:hypothetical protein
VQGDTGGEGRLHTPDSIVKNNKNYKTTRKYNLVRVCVCVSVCVCVCVCVCVRVVLKRDTVKIVFCIHINTYNEKSETCLCVCVSNEKL